MPNSLDDITNREYGDVPKQDISKTKKPDTIDDIANEVDEFAKIQEQKIEGKTGIFKKIIDIGSFVGGLYLQLKLLPAKIVYTSLIPMFGFILSKFRGEKKAGKKFTWAKFFRTGYLGQIMGYADVLIFSLPEYLFKLAPSIFTTGAAFSFLTGSKFLRKMLAGTATTLAFNPTLVPPYNVVYTAANYFRDKIGYGKALLRPHKFVKYMKHMYQTEIKGKWKEDTKNVFKYIFPFHWLQMVAHPNVYTRLLQSIFVNNKVYADVMERKEKEEKKIIPMNRDYRDGDYADKRKDYRQAA